ncbi:hypothetical protein BN137_2390 [Cronobacter condimenti 1330]|uniref:DUF2142 domain-containing protein n=1 Tax=Cronobacter condimenti 1330 TaxID=1073999 RepID=K8AB78_9ENTR|nr:hypothetical protein [Cronobacter condimenti]CCJ73019.1 hypothetical protein BN137_2390 [Cronobacter condimenti 1330]
MMYWALISVFGYFIYLVFVAKLKWQQAPFITLSICTCILYVSGILGFLEQGWGIAISLGFVLGTYAIYKERPVIHLTWNNVLAALVSVAPFIFSFLSVKNDYLFTDWDEFSFWGASIKIMTVTNAIYDGGSSLSNTFKAYPPFQQLAQYLFVYPAGWSESAVLKAHNVYIYSAMLFASATVIRKDVLLAAIAFAASSTFIYFFKYDIGHVLVDQLLGVAFLSALCVAVSACEKDRKYLLPLIIFILPLIKQIGLVFGLFAIACAFVHIALGKNGGFKSRLIEAFKLSVLCLAVLLVSFKSWSLYLSSVDVTPVFSASGPINWASAAMQDKISVTLAELNTRILNPLYFSYATLHFRPLTIFMIGVAMIAPIAIMSKGRRLQETAIAAILPLMFASYIAFLVYCYIAYFSEFESKRLASFERYAGTFLIAWASFLLYKLVDLSWRGFRSAYSLIAILAVALPVYGVTGYYRLDLRRFAQNRKKQSSGRMFRACLT